MSRGSRADRALREALRQAIYGRGGYGTQRIAAQAFGVKPWMVSRWLCGVHRIAPPYAWAIRQAVASQAWSGWVGPWVAPWVSGEGLVRDLESKQRELVARIQEEVDSGSVRGN